MDKLFLFPWLTSFIIAFLTTPFVVRFASKLGIIDDPKKNNHPKVIHTVPTPRGGGIPIFLALLITTVLFLPIDKHLMGILIGALVLVLTGTLDDRYNLNPYLRLAICFIATTIPIAAGIGIGFISNPLGGIIDLSQPQIVLNFFGRHTIWLIADLFALLWITFLMNVVNMGAKGVDGQLSGVTVISALTITLISLKYSSDISQWPVIILASITGGAYLGFLPWHIYPQKIMPGYGGSTLAGYLLGILSILATAKVGVLLVVLGVPLIDTGYTIVRRVIQGKSPVWGDRGHLHHKLLDAGLTKGQVALFYWGMTALLGFAALNLNTASKVYTIIGISVFLGGLLLFLTHQKEKT